MKVIDFLQPSAIIADLVVSASPIERAGAASALNETSSEFGGAIGIALLGSLATFLYRSTLQAALPLGMDDRPATTRTVTEPNWIDGGRVAGADDLAGVLDDLRHEPARVEVAMLDLPELRLPFARQLR